jgi:hypothetical protein
MVIIHSVVPNAPANGGSPSHAIVAVAWALMERLGPSEV